MNSDLDFLADQQYNIILQKQTIMLCRKFGLPHGGNNRNLQLSKEVISLKKSRYILSDPEEGSKLLDIHHSQIEDYTKKSTTTQRTAGKYYY